MTIRAQIQAALAGGTIAQVTGLKLGSYFYCCPWSAIDQVRRPVKIGGKRLSVPQQFTFDVSGEELAAGGAFMRRIVLRPFTPHRGGLRDPTGGGHHHDYPTGVSIVQSFPQVTSSVDRGRTLLNGHHEAWSPPCRHRSRATGSAQGAGDVDGRPDMVPDEVSRC